MKASEEKRQIREQENRYLDAIVLGRKGVASRRRSTPPARDDRGEQRPWRPGLK